jgi:hypothetical protein
MAQALTSRATSEQAFLEDIIASCGVQEDDVSTDYTGLSLGIFEAAPTGTIKLIVGNAWESFLRRDVTFLSCKMD